MPIPSVSKPLLWRCAVPAVILLLCLSAYRTGAALYHNYNLRQEFSAAPSPGPYELGIPMNQMDLAVYDPLFNSTHTGRGKLLLFQELVG